MKKHVLTALAMLSIAFGASAQQNADVKISKYKVDPNQAGTQIPVSTIQSKGGQVATFYEVHQAVVDESVNKQYQSFAFLIFPDTNTVTLDEGDTLRYNSFIQAMGQVIDPTADIWDFYQASNSDAQKLDRRDKYSIDSLYYTYTYPRFIQEQTIGGTTFDVVDTLYIEYFKAKRGTSNGGMNYGRIIYTTYNDTQDFTRPDFDLASRLSETPFKREAVLLTTDDSTGTENDKSFRFKTVVRPVGIDVAAGEVFTAVLQFRPGSIYSVGDTILASGTIKPSHKNVNIFGLRGLQYQGEFAQQFKQKDNYNNSIYVPAGWSLKDPNSNRNGWEYGYLPSLNLFPIMGYHITANSTGSVNKINNDYSIGNVYPNPARAGQDVTVEFSAKNASTVSVELFDLLGKKVNTTVTINNNTAVINTSDLNSGMYIVNLKSDNQTVSTKKVNIVR